MSSSTSSAALSLISRPSMPCPRRVISCVRVLFFGALLFALLGGLAARARRVVGQLALELGHHLVAVRDRVGVHAVQGARREIARRERIEPGAEGRPVGEQVRPGSHHVPRAPEAALREASQRHAAVRGQRAPLGALGERGEGVQPVSERATFTLLPGGEDAFPRSPSSASARSRSACMPVARFFT